jgi:L-threonylcarbamoyladenylate synthase
MLAKHYAPRTPLVYVRGTGPAARERLRALVRERTAAGERVGILTYDEDREIAGEPCDLGGEPAAVELLGSIEDTERVARRLFAAMRTLDARGVDVILARQPSPVGLGAALDDRLRRAAGKVIEVR